MTSLVFFGTLLKSSRASKGLLLKEMAGLAGLDAGLLSKIENNERRATAEQCETFIQILNADADRFRTAWLAGKILYEIEGKPQQKAALETALNHLKQNEEEAVNTDEIYTEIESLIPYTSNPFETLAALGNFKYESIHDCCSAVNNPLTIKEIFEVVENGNTIVGKSLQHHLEVYRFAKAWPIVEAFTRQASKPNGIQLWQLHVVLNDLYFKQITGIEGFSEEDSSKFITRFDHISATNQLHASAVKQCVTDTLLFIYQFNGIDEVLKTAYLYLYISLWRLGLPVLKSVSVNQIEFDALTKTQFEKKLAINILNALKNKEGKSL